MTSQSRISIHKSDGRANCVIFYSLDTYKALLQTKSLHPVRKNVYPYRSYGQPILAWAAFIGCLLILILFNSAFLWNGFHLVPFLTAFVPVRCNKDLLLSL